MPFSYYPCQGEGVLAAAAPVELCSVLIFAFLSGGTGGLHVFLASLCTVSGRHDAL